MKLYTIHSGDFKLDGGSMFSIVPKAMWSKVYPADEHNLCTWALRCLLVEDGNRLVLIDTGIGSKQNDAFFRRFPLVGDRSLEGALQQQGFCRDDITDVFFTHLHFDHCGGAVQWNSTRSAYEPVFKNARYWTTKAQLEAFIHPNPREKASFLKENIIPLHDGGRLSFVEAEGDLFAHIRVRFYHGHTRSQMLPFITCNGTTVVFMGDLVPSCAHVPLPWIMSYDTRPLVTLDEKEELLNEAADGQYVLVFAHDHYTECCTVRHTERGVRVGETFSLAGSLA